MQLPESVADSVESSSIPYGSLNDSQFRHPSSGHNAGNGNGNGIGADNFSSSYNPSSSQLDIQKRVQQMKKNGTLIKNEKGGLASLFGGGGSGQSGSSALHVMHNNSTSNSNDNNSSSSNTRMNRDAEQDRSYPLHGEVEPASVGPKYPQGETRTLGGIGSLIEQSSIPSNITLSTAAAQSRTSQVATPFSLGSADHSISNTIHINSNLNDGATVSSLNTNLTNANADCSQLSGSLTGLSILKSSPRGLAVDLGREEKEAMAIRARSYSDDGSGFLTSSTTNIRSTDISKSMNIGIGRSMLLGPGGISGKIRAGALSSSFWDGDTDPDTSDDMFHQHQDQLQHPPMSNGDPVFRSNSSSDVSDSFPHRHQHSHPHPHGQEDHDGCNMNAEGDHELFDMDM
mmetsp:Transcript_20790/g.30470  ORF Transcript_20790/g.30470 Transcript_20790/m.30470 type:complete len:400 (+) Transcript_20790:37-1236(+)